MRKRIIFPFIITLLLVATIAYGGKKPGTQYAGLILEVSKAVSEPVSVYCVPDGTGYAIASAFAYNGGMVDASLTVKVMDEFSRPLAGVPAENILLGPVEPKNSFCGDAGAVIGSGATDASGIIVLDGVIKGSGYVLPTGDGLIIMATNGTDTGESAPVGVYMNSADINNDGVVDAADLELFNRDMAGRYNYRSDFNWDGVIDSFDNTMFNAAMGKSCN